MLAKKIKKIKKNFVYVCNERMRWRCHETYKNNITVIVGGSSKSSVGPNAPLRDPVYELVYDCQDKQVLFQVFKLSASL